MSQYMQDNGRQACYANDLQYLCCDLEKHEEKTVGFPIRESWSQIHGFEIEGYQKEEYRTRKDMNGASTQGDPAGASEDSLGRLSCGPSAKQCIEELKA